MAEAINGDLFYLLWALMPPSRTGRPGITRTRAILSMMPRSESGLSYSARLARRRSEGLRSSFAKLTDDPYQARAARIWMWSAAAFSSGSLENALIISSIMVTRRRPIRSSPARVSCRLNPLLPGTE
jgi:hypothetical protein